MFITRTISGAVLLLVVFSTLVIGGPVWLAVTCMLSVMALFELTKALKIDKTAMAWEAYAACILLYTVLGCGHPELIIVIFVAYFTVVMATYVIRWPKYEVNTSAKSLFSFFYAVFLMSFLYQIRIMDSGIYYMWLVFISAWGSDTCAYLTGILIGKHKMPGTLSPKKSIEGCIGGGVGAAVIGFIYGMYLKDITLGAVFAGICLCGSVISQIGDLAASAVKRNCGIKDYAKLIPGHGGIMDRFDSIMFVSPIIYCILYCMNIMNCMINFG